MTRKSCAVRMRNAIPRNYLKDPLKYLLMPLLGKNQLAITLHMYASVGPNLDNTHHTTPNVTWPETEKCILLEWLKHFFRIFCTITIQKPFRRNLSTRWLMIKNKEMRKENMLLWPLFCAWFFCFRFCRQTHAWIARKYDVLSNCFKIQQLQLSLEEKVLFFAAPEVMTEFSAAWYLSIVSQAAEATYIRWSVCGEFAIILPVSHRGR